MPPCGYTMTRMLWCKHNLFKNSFYFQNEASTTLETKIFSNSIYYSWKVIFLLTYGSQKNWWSLLENLLMGHLLEIWWSGSKDLFSQFGWAKGVARFQSLFLKKWILWKSSILKRFIFLVPEYGNLTSVTTHRDRIENSGGGHSGTRSSNFWFWRG